jgi:hypothetical protein
VPGGACSCACRNARRKVVRPRAMTSSSLSLSGCRRAPMARWLAAAQSAAHCRPSGVMCSRTRRPSRESPSLRTIRSAARRVIRTDTRLFGSPVTRASSLTVMPGCSEISRSAARDSPYRGSGNCPPAASRTCWRRKSRITSRSSPATWSCASARAGAAFSGAAIRVVSDGTFTPQQCRRSSRAGRGRMPPGRGTLAIPGPHPPAPVAPLVSLARRLSAPSPSARAGSRAAGPLSRVRDRGLLSACCGVAGQQQGCRGAALDLP